MSIIWIVIKDCLIDVNRVLLKFLTFSVIGSLLKLSWFFYNEKQKEATLQMIEKELMNLLLDNDDKIYDGLAKELQELYVWFLEH